jgi:glutamine synthetase type III
VSNEKIISKNKISSIWGELKKVNILQQSKTPMYELLEYVDELENLFDDELWPRSKFLEMLFIS